MNLKKNLIILIKGVIEIDNYIVKTWINYEKYYSEKFDDYKEALEYFNKKVNNYKKIEAKEITKNKNVSFSISLERLDYENKFLKQKGMLLDIDYWLNRI